MTFTALIVVLLFAHFFADFICQTSWMALGKSKALLPLLCHVAVYTVVLGMVLDLSYLVAYQPTHVNIAPFIILNGVFHLVTDYFTSKVNAKLWASGNMHNFFVGIGFDQFIHGACLVLTASAMLGA